MIINLQREAKPAWSEVPRELKHALERILGGTIADAAVAWGGYGPSATFILRTSDERKFFCKGTHPGFTDLGKTAFLNELSYYSSIPELAEFGPAFRGVAQHAEWHLLVLDYVERTIEVPPWTDETFRGAIKMLARFHSGMPASARRVLPIAEEQTDFMALYKAEGGWKSIASEDQRAEFLALFNDNAAAARSWVHHDVRSDNLLFREADQPLLIDFPYLAYGPTLMDVAFFLPSVAGEGGALPADGLRRYEQMSYFRFEARDVAVTVATVAGFFAARAGQRDLPDLPRLRWVQKLQLFPSLTWLSELLKIQPPPAPKPF